jgi:hypothetical protein
MTTGVMSSWLKRFSIVVALGLAIAGLFLFSRLTLDSTHKEVNQSLGTIETKYYKPAGKLDMVELDGSSNNLAFGSSDFPVEEKYYFKINGTVVKVPLNTFLAYNTGDMVFITYTNKNLISIVQKASL